MSSTFRDPRYDPSRRRQGARRDHRHNPSSSLRSPLTRLATASAVAYGAYRLGTWAWNAYSGGEVGDGDGGDSDKDEEDSDEEDSCIRRFSYGMADDYRAVQRDIRREEGFSPCHSEDETETDDDSLLAVSNCDDPNTERRSRRSRIDWSQSHRRSNSPSPPKGYHHHSPQGGAVDNRCGETTMTMGQGLKEAAAAAASGIGSAVGAGISAGIHACKNQGGKADSSSDAPDQERCLRMGRCRLEISRAMADFLPTLKKAIAKETDVCPMTNELKRLRARKRILEMEQNDQNREAVSEEEDRIRMEEWRLWNDIKNRSVARLVITVYAHTIVFLVLTVQVNLLGGRLLREERKEREILTKAEQHSVVPPVMDRYRASHQTVLTKTYHYLFSRGIPSLAETIADFVEEILQQWDVLDGDEVSLEDISMWIERSRYQMERRSCRGGSSLARYVIPPEVESDSEHADVGVADELARFILDETYDLLESPTFATAERQCLDATFEQLQAKSIVKLFLAEDRTPLASAVTHIQKSAVATFHSPPSQEQEEMKGCGRVLGMMKEQLPSAVPNEYILMLERLDAVMDMGDVCF